MVDYDAPNLYCTNVGDWPPSYTCQSAAPLGGYYLALDGSEVNVAWIYFERGTWDTGIDIPCGTTSSHTARIHYQGSGGTVFANNSTVTSLTGTCPDRRTCPSSGAGKPINVGSGDVAATQRLFAIGQEPLPLPFTLTYHSATPTFPALVTSPVGVGWTHEYAQTLRPEDASNNRLYHIAADGAESEYLRFDPDTFWTAINPAELRGTITLNSTTHIYEVLDLDGRKTAFYDSSGQAPGPSGAWVSTTDRWGNSIVGTYDAAGKLSTITDSVGRQVTLTYLGSLLQTISIPETPTARIWTLSYVGSLLSTITDPVHPATVWRTFNYTRTAIDGVTLLPGGVSLLASITDDATPTGGKVLEGHQYDTLGRGVTSFSEGGNRDFVTVDYDVPVANKRTVTHRIDASTSQVSVFTLAYLGGRWLPKLIVGPCATCAGADGDTQSFTYTFDNHIDTKTDGRGNVTKFLYNTDGNVISMTEAQGDAALARTTIWEYLKPAPVWPNVWTKVTVRSTDGNVAHNKVTTRDWNTAETTLTSMETGFSGGIQTAYITTQNFDTKHRLTSVNGPRTSSPDTTHTTVYAYYSDPLVINNLGRLSSVTNAVTLQTSFADYDVYGTARTTTDPSGAQTVLQLDERGRTLTRALKPVVGDPVTGDFTTTYVFDRDRLASVTSPLLNSTAYVYEDGTNRLTQTIRRDTSANQLERLLHTLNDIGGKTREDAQECTAAPSTNCSASWATRRFDSFGYDNKNRLKTVTHPDSSAIVYTYDADGLLSTVQDERHVIPNTPNTIYGYDNLNRLKTVTQKMPLVAAPDVVTTYDYDLQDNVKTVTDPNGNVTTYVYDDFRRMTSQTSPVSGATSYTYDAFTNLFVTTDANTAATTRTYDNANRILTATSTRPGSSTEVVTNAYDDTVSLYGKGRLKSSSVTVGGAPTVSTAYTYERRGLTLSESNTIAGVNSVQSYGYDANGNRRSITYPSGRVVGYTFDFADRPLTVGLSGAPAAYVSSATYWPFGPEKALAFGNGTTRTASQDQRYLPSTLTLTGGSVGSSVSYTYSPDGVGNITGIADSGNAGYNRSFGYDDLNRLTSATTSSTPLWGTGTFTYGGSFNIGGNAVRDNLNRRQLVLGGRTVNYDYATQNNHWTTTLASESDLSPTTTIGRDAVGNETAFGTTRSTYSARNQLVATSGANAPLDQTYDGRGVRVQEAAWAQSELPFHSLTPCRIIDTRAGSGFAQGYGQPSIAGGTQRTFVIAGQCGVPADAKAVSFNFAVWIPTTRGDLRVFPAGAVTPVVSTLNWEAGILALANAAIVPLGAGGAITVLVDGPGTVDIFVDINGYFPTPSGAGDLSFHAVSPCRLVDTRANSGFPAGYGPPSIAGGGQRTFVIAGQCGIPLNAGAVSFNVSVWIPQTRGDLRIFPAGAVTPTVSTLNWEAGILALANAAIVPLGTGGGITVLVDGPGTVDIFVDINGYFPAPTGPDDLSFHAVQPCRLIDTRPGSGYPAGYGQPSMLGNSAQRTFAIAGQCGIPSNASAVSLNVAVWVPTTRGDLRLFPAGVATPTVSTLNWEAGILALANAAIVPLGTGAAPNGGAINAVVDGPGTVDIFVDINGYFAHPALISRNFFYNPELNLLSETNQAAPGTNPTPLWDYVWFNGRPVAQESTSGTRRFTMTDHLGTPFLQTDTSGAITWRAEYEPFGNLYAQRVTTGSTEYQPLRFPGQEARDTTAGRSYNIFRWYRPDVGQYTQADPLGIAGGLDVYAYADGNPITDLDDDGLAAIVTNTRENTCFFCTIYAETRGQPAPCQWAVASVIVNLLADERTRYPGKPTSLCDAVQLKYHRFDGYGKDNDNYQNCSNCRFPKEDLPDVEAFASHFASPFPVAPNARFFGTKRRGAGYIRVPFPQCPQTFFYNETSSPRPRPRR